MDWETWRFAFGVTVPNLLLLILGVILRRFRLLDDAFCDGATRLVFHLALPCLLFFSIATNHTSLLSNLPLALYGAAGTLLIFLLLELAAPLLIKNPRERGIFVQGGFRANTAIVGLAYASMAYGSEGVAIGSLFMAATVILFNVLSVVTLTRSLSGGRQTPPGSGAILRSIATNPLITGLVAGLAWRFSGLAIPQPVIKTGSFISGMALPLAMLCAGASLDWRMMFRATNTAIYAAVARVVMVPALLTLGGALCGFRGAALGVIFLFSATPTAAASYVMTRAMGGNATLAANIIAMTTVGSFFTTAIGLFVLRSTGVI